jgi:D-amino-acid dehydrogenase
MVIGAGFVGLSVAWFLRRVGLDVLVLERREVAAGASAGNAGWISPGLSGPLVSAAAVRLGMRGLWDPGAPVAVPPREAVRAASFLAAFARNSAPARSTAAMAALEPINRCALQAFDRLSAAGVPIQLYDVPILTAFHDRAAASAMAAGLAPQVAAGRLQVEEVDGARLLQLEPSLGEQVEGGLLIGGQRWLDPLVATRALASAAVAAGVDLRVGAEVVGVRAEKDVGVVLSSGGVHRADVVVVAAGAWSARLLSDLGVRVPLAAGRGYRVVVRPQMPLTHPLYLPEARLACTPDGEMLRVTGIMELGDPDGPPRARRLRTVLEDLRRYVVLGSDDAGAAWVGARPLSADGLPLVGATNVPGVYLATGHGMYGMTLGPATGELLARFIVTGEEPKELVPLSPTRPALLDVD